MYLYSHEIETTNLDFISKLKKLMQLMVGFVVCIIQNLSIIWKQLLLFVFIIINLIFVIRDGNVAQT